MLFFVTGCSTGLGLQLAQAILAAGHDCIASSRNPSKTPDLVADFEKKGGKWVHLDISGKDVESTMANILVDHGPIDVLINNAGVTDVGPIENMPRDQARAVFETNFWGPLRVMQAVMPSMRERKSGSIVNISSSSVFNPFPLLGIYSASKGAIECLADSLNSEMGAFGIRTLVVEPGLLRTEFSDTGKVDVDGIMARSAMFQGTYVEQVMAQLTAFHGNEPGDPVKVAKVIIDEVLSPKAQPPTPRLILSADAIQFAKGKVQGLEAAVALGETIDVGFA
ncbi:putative oxido YusZ [Cyphellophora attinorum]|uniref:Putative oxido YusZ n=1 Tax=Cyphellophora attinorum TaxID=1664694 RepID=A0A0N1H744_9EURO|nr:putative oxido YusZ [Phialophora attinorum]KPI37362.1 putative oxido YusZ [Phialophora attinorum]